MSPHPRRRGARAHPWRGYAPREPHRLVLLLVERLCAANHSDHCIVSIEKIRELLATWWRLERSRRWVCYHLKAAAREMLIFRQTRWQALGGRLVIRARTRYRIGWRQFQRLASSARAAARLLALHAGAPRRETMQRIALGLQNLLNSVVPAAP